MEDVVITGMSGRLPQSENIEEFAQKLYAGVDLVTEHDRWTPGLLGLPRRMGTIGNLSDFDAAFFSVPSQQANRMDVHLRKLLEVTYETIIDAGLNLEEYRGSNTGVFVGAYSSDSEEIWNEDLEKIVGYTQTGCCRAMLSNRVSYTFDFKGPSMTINTACSSSMVALIQGVKAIRSGECEAAIVAGAVINLRPHTSLGYKQLKLISQSGRCAAFDENASGYVKSDTVIAMLLQKRRQAHRVYATVRGVSINTDGYKTHGICYPSGEMQKKVIETAFKDAKLNPEDVTFVEAHGTGTQAGDFVEGSAIASTYCKNRSVPLLVGSVKSNMGHSEISAGLCSVAKVLLSMERNVIPSNLHYRNPNPKVTALTDGKIKVIDKNTEWAGGFAGVSSFGYGGVNAHVVLEGGNESRSKPTEYPFPRLVVASGRTEAAVHSLLNLAAEHPRDAGLHALLDNVHAINIKKHPHRGYKLLTAADRTEIFEIKENRPLWFVFSGFKSHWPGSYRTLFKIPSFAKTLDVCAEALKPHGVNLHYLMKEAPEAELTAFTSFLSITFMQIALVDFLRSLEINPDGIIGHSLGEIGCAYADGALSAEQCILSAYWRIKSVLDSEISGGAMAIVALSGEECAKLCPPGVTIACYNSKAHVTVSGPQKSIEKFVKDLTSKKITAKLFHSDGVGYHSECIALAAPLLLKRLQSVITDPKQRTQKWISSSMLQDSGNGRACDAAYFVNNFTSPVRFEQAMRQVPENAALIEIAPDAYFQGLLKRQKTDAVTVALSRQDSSDSCEQLLSAVGRLYGAGAQPRMSSLYPGLNSPVSRGTPSLAPRLLWDHSVAYDVPKFKNSQFSGGKLTYDLSKPEDSFLSSHNVDGRTLFPSTGYLVMVWKTATKLHNLNIEDAPIIFENVQFKRAILMPPSGPVEFSITILKSTGDFDIFEGEASIVTGRVHLVKSPMNQKVDCPNLMSSEKESLVLSTDDVYRELRVRGYSYSGLFCGIKSYDVKTSTGEVIWNNNWITFLHTALQFKLVGLKTKRLNVFTSLQYTFIDPKKVLDAISPDNTLPIFDQKEMNVVTLPGIEFHGVKVRSVARQANQQQTPVLESYNFLPYDNTTLNSTITMQNAYFMMMQIILENMEFATNMKIIEFVYANSSEVILQELSSILRYLSRHKFDLTLAVGNKENQCAETLNLENIKVLSTKDLSSRGGYQFVLAANILTQPMVEEYLKTILFNSESGMVLLQESLGTIDKKTTDNLLERLDLIVLSKLIVVSGELLLLRRRPVVPTDNIIVEIKDESFDWIEQLREALKSVGNDDRRVYAVSRSHKSGIVGLGICFRIELNKRALRIYFLPNTKENSSQSCLLHPEQMKKDVYINVLQGKTWGSYRHSVLPDVQSQTVQTGSAYVKILNAGNLSSLTWVSNYLQKENNENLCRVHYAALNFHDIMLATGKLYEESVHMDPEECHIGLEYSGVMSNGKRVMGMVGGHGLATSLQVDPDFLMEVPDDWSLEEAATVPVAYLTAYYALAVRGRMRRGEVVLVHAGSGGVGLAAIAVALHAGLTVFTTVGTPDKRAFLLKRFPDLSPDNIGNSRDTSFEQLVRRCTRGRGVDLVLNSLAGDQLLASLRCLAPGGRFLEIGRYNITEDKNLGMSIFLRNTTFHGVRLKDLFNDGANDKEKIALLQHMKEGIRDGTITPLTREVFNSQQVEEAFRYMAAGKHIGKVMLQIRGEKAELMKEIHVKPQVNLHPNKFCIIISGLGGFGLELAHWLVAHGARNLILSSRSGVRTKYQMWNIHRLREKGARVIVDIRDCTSEIAARSLLEEVNQMAPVSAIFNLAAILKDCSFDSQTPEYFEMVTRPKINVTTSLDVASRELCPELEYFVVFSSVTSGRGNFGQTNYGFANSAMERIIENRLKDNLPGVAIQWGLIGDVGIVHDLLKIKVSLGGVALQPIASCLDTLGDLLIQPHAVVTSWIPYQKNTTTVQNRQDVAPAIKNILGISPSEKISKATTLEELGMDSLVGAEIKKTLERQYNIHFEIKEIYSLSYGKLEEIVFNAVKEGSQAVDDFLANIPVFEGKELVPKCVMLKLPNKDTESTRRPVFMVHPIEGVAESLRDIAVSTNAPVYAFQCDASVPTTNMEALARCYVEHLRAVQPLPPYTLLGYSYGAAIAFEMMYQLEQEGCKCCLICVDGSPQYLKAIARDNKLSAKTNDPDSHVRILTYITKVVKNSETTKVADCLKGKTNWEDRVDAVANLLRSKMPFPASELRMTLNRFREMVRIVDEYDVAKRVNGPVTLFTSSENRVEVDDDYGLRDMCSSPLVKRQLKATHLSIVTGECARTIADYINHLINS